jgi:hypothetical protein
MNGMTEKRFQALAVEGSALKANSSRRLWPFLLVLILFNTSAAQSYAQVTQSLLTIQKKSLFQLYSPSFTLTLKLMSTHVVQCGTPTDFQVNTTYGTTLRGFSVLQQSALSQCVNSTLRSQGEKSKIISKPARGKRLGTTILLTSHGITDTEVIKIVQSLLPLH